MSGARVSFSEGTAKAASLKDSLNNNSGQASRANSLARRASLPPQRISITEDVGKGTSGQKGGAATLRRASVGNGMLSAPFKRTPKESPRWRPFTYEAQHSGNVLSKVSSSSLFQDDPNKPMNQRIFEKSAASLALGLFVIICLSVVGVVTRLILRRDLGILGFYLNQLFLIFVFCTDRRKDADGNPTEERRKDNLNAFEVGTLICQILPILYIMRAGSMATYSGLTIVIILQVVLKALLMVALNEVVEIAL